MTARSRAPLVLGYHAVSSTWRSQLAIPEQLFARQVDSLARRGYVGLTLSEAERRRQAGSLPPRPVVFTFDDGYASTMRALPILHGVGFPGTVFPVTRFVDTGKDLAWTGMVEERAQRSDGELRPLGWEDIEHLHDAGWEVGSHTLSHPLLTTVDDERLRSELSD